MLILRLRSLCFKRHSLIVYHPFFTKEALLTFNILLRASVMFTKRLCYVIGLRFIISRKPNSANSVVVAGTSERGVFHNETQTASTTYSFIYSF